MRCLAQRRSASRLGPRAPDGGDTLRGLRRDFARRKPTPTPGFPRSSSTLGRTRPAGLRTPGAAPHPLGAPLGRLLPEEPAEDGLRMDLAGEADAAGAEELIEAVDRSAATVGDLAPEGGPQQPGPLQAPGGSSQTCSQCEVCGGAGVKYRVAIAGLDSDYTGTPYAGLEQYARNFMNAHKLRKQARLTAPKRSASGPFSYTNSAARGMPAGMFTAGHFLFFVDWDICETDKSPCRVRVSETVTVTRGGKTQTTKKPPVTPSLGNAWTKAPRKTPLGKCNKSLIWVDAPGDIAITSGKSAKGFKLTVSQKIEVLAGTRVAATTNESISVGVDATGKLTASP